MTSQSSHPRCFACGGVYHPASGHWWREFNLAYCGPCYRNFLSWFKGHVARRWGGAKFYDEAANCIKIPFSNRQHPMPDSSTKSSTS